MFLNFLCLDNSVIANDRGLRPSVCNFKVLNTELLAHDLNKVHILSMAQLVLSYSLVFAFNNAIEAQYILTMVLLDHLVALCFST